MLLALASACLCPSHVFLVTVVFLFVIFKKESFAYILTETMAYKLVLTVNLLPMFCSRYIPIFT